MNTFTKRIAGIVTAGLLTVSGVAMIAQTAYAVDPPKHSITVQGWIDGCKGTDGHLSHKAVDGIATSVSCTWDNGDGTHTKTTCPVSGNVVDTSDGKCSYGPAHTTTPVRKLTVKNTGIVVVTTAGTHVSIKRSAATGITTIRTPGSAPVRVVPPSAVTGPGSPVVSPGGTLTPPTTIPPRPGTGVVVSPGGALGG